MKKIVLITSLVTAISSVSCHTKVVVPAKVKDTFAQRFPDVKPILWEKEDEKEWEVNFKIDGVKHSANFLEDGTWKETEYEISKKDLPEFILQSLKANFEDFEIEEVEISETKTGKAYEIEIEVGEEKLEVLLDMKGTIIKKEVKEDD
ncbi:PepSY-like domain-containing protein [Aquimarina latercula]|uniref:PepSY-like domain-containing protein n=1 Tax=Aquimarina latercula TaxID=987 RepID=UPI0003F86A2C|nr:PepSY-like domain-containing protein [Aquimarina latercula]